MTDITELAPAMKAAAIDAKELAIIARYSKGRAAAEKFYALANPNNVIALVEALEKAQETIAFQQGEIKALLSSLESRTVKLPDDEDGQAYGFGKWANGKLPATAGTMTIAYCEDAWRVAFEVFSSAAGIKVEAE
ncbi:hypothetical protein [Klebsiella pneumoniae]|uniref:hypothetical protein n=1 Tax=Klebsiella pneumoniae TaxID=573 RepID=UPI0019625F25|nr:hypothetical protein [Klebsiella pneumoniae]HCT3183769.1 hypothetical protein [Klebsiella pneumoniae]HDI1962952.1 hypothetical protein [Klebsiella pneumoniae]